MAYLQRFAFGINSRKKLLSFIFNQHSVFRKHLNFIGEPIYSDRIHLEACFKWLLLAQKKSKSKGISRAYSITLGWFSAYPETTGYIIDTFIDYYQFTKDTFYLKKAIELGDWELSIQLPDGSIPLRDPETKESDVFDTGMVLLGICTLYSTTGEERFKHAAIKLGNWLIENQDATGAWSRNSYKDVPHVYHSKVSWALFKLFLITKDVRYESAVINNLSWIFAQKDSNDWFNYMGFDGNENPYSHTFAYTLQGFMELYKLMVKRTADSTIPPYVHQNELFEVCKRLCDKFIDKFNLVGACHMLMLPGEYDSNYDSIGKYACLTGNSQLALVYFDLYDFTGKSEYRIAGNNLIDVVKQSQYIGEVAEGVTESVSELEAFHQVIAIKKRRRDRILGAIPGSFPLWEKYHSNEYPNWAVKFFADALMRKMKL